MGVLVSKAPAYFLGRASLSHHDLRDLPCMHMKHSNHKFLCHQRDIRVNFEVRVFFSCISVFVYLILMGNALIFLYLASKIHGSTFYFILGEQLLS